MGTMPTYTYPQEVWDIATCKKHARYCRKDGMGTTCTTPGLISDHASNWPGYGSSTRFNGGTLINGKLYGTVTKPLPKIPESYEIVNVSSWGYQIRKKGK